MRQPAKSKFLSAAFVGDGTAGGIPRESPCRPPRRAVLGIRERVLGAEHPDTLGSRYRLAVSLRDLGRRKEALVESNLPSNLRYLAQRAEGETLAAVGENDGFPPADLPRIDQQDR